MPTASSQPELFELAEVDGYAVLNRREQLFAQGLFEGQSQREAAKRAGFKGSEQCIDAAASRAVKNVKVQRLMNQAWSRAGVSIDGTLRQAAELQARAFREARDAETAERRKAAFAQWKDASALIASIHGKLTLKVEHSGTVRSVISDEDRAHLAELSAAGVPVTMPAANTGGRN